MLFLTTQYSLTRTAERLAATHLHFAGSGERRTEGLLRRGSSVQRLEPTSSRSEYDENYAHDKHGHQDGIQVASKYLTGLGGQWPEDIFDRQHSRGNRSDTHEAHRNGRNPGILPLAHINKEGSRHRKRDGCQQLVS